MPLKKNTFNTTKNSIKKINENNNVNAGKIGSLIDLNSINIDEKTYWTINKSKKKIYF